MLRVSPSLFIPISFKSFETLRLSPSLFVPISSDFYDQVCGFHYFTFPSIVGYTLPYAWVGNSVKLYLGVSTYPFAVSNYIPGLKLLKSPNVDLGVDRMISVIGHEIAKLATNLLVNTWYARQDLVALVEIVDLCKGIYEIGGGGSYTGQLLNDRDGATTNPGGFVEPRTWFRRTQIWVL